MENEINIDYAAARSVCGVTVGGIGAGAPALLRNAVILDADMTEKEPPLLKPPLWIRSIIIVVGIVIVPAYMAFRWSVVKIRKWLYNQ